MKTRLLTQRRKDAKTQKPKLKFGKLKAEIISAFCFLLSAFSIDAAALITNSTFTVGVTQRDGRAFVLEVHTDLTGAKHRVIYLSAPSDNRQQILTNRIASIEQRLVDAEETRMLCDLGTPSFIFTTKALFLATFRAEFKTAKKERVCALSKWILDRLEAGDWTDNQMAVLFSVSLAVWTTTVKPQLADMRDKWNSVQAANGQ